MEDDALKVAGEGLIYTGYFSVLVQQDMNLPVPYYTEIKGSLVRLGCIEQLHRGGGKTPSVWKLYFPPEPHLFEQSRLQNGVQRRRPASITRLEQSILLLNNRLLEVEKVVARLLKEVSSGV